MSFASVGHCCVIAQRATQQTENSIVLGANDSWLGLLVFLPAFVDVL